MGAVAAPLAAQDALAPDRRRAPALAAAIAAAGGVACALSIAAPAFHGLPLHPVDQTIHAGVAAVYIGAGVVALLRRPGNATGPLMAAVGFLWLVQDLYWIWQPLPVTIASAYERLYQAALANLALVFPTGRFPGRFERRVMVGLWVWTLGNNLVRMLFYDPRFEGCTGCPRNMLKVSDNETAYHVADHVSTYGSLAAVVFAAGVIVRHWWRATRAARHVMAPVLWVVGPAVAFILSQEFEDVVTVSSYTQHVIIDYLPVGLAVLPIGFLIGLLRTRLAYAQVGALLPELSTQVAPGRVRGALAATLHDPDLELLYWSPAGESYVDLDGNRQEPTPGPGRAVSAIDGESGPLALMIVDKVTLDEPQLLRSAVAMARLALENERLQAEVRSQLVQLRSSTARIVEAGQDARRRLERDLHDGAQQRLLALAMTLGRARARAGMAGDPELRTFLDHAADDLQHAIGELRELARGIHPVLLTQEGLGSALRALAERAPLPVEVAAPALRFPETVEATAYFLVAEAITNAARHSGAEAVQVEATVEATGDGGDLVLRVRDDGIGGVDEASAGFGSGLVGMRDRAVALGGTLRIVSPPGVGTTLVARLPCG
jgi:signal transduction histidine kinase